MSWRARFHLPRVRGLEPALLVSIWLMALSVATVSVVAKLSEPRLVTLARPHWFAIPGLAAAGLLGLYFFLSPDGKRRRPLSLATAVLLLCFIVSLFTARTVDLQLAEGGRMPLEAIGDSLGIDFGDTTTLVLNRIEVSGGYGSGTPTCRSHFAEPGTTRELVSATNRPLRLGPLTLHQKGWQVDIQRLTYEFEGRLYQYRSPLDLMVRTRDSCIFSFSPSGVRRGEIVYRWELYHPNQAILAMGGFTSRDSTTGDLQKRFGFKIVASRATPVSLIQASHRPADPWLAAVALCYLIVVLLDFWGGRLRQAFARRRPEEARP